MSNNSIIQRKFLVRYWPTVDKGNSPLLPEKEIHNITEYFRVDNTVAAEVETRMPPPKPEKERKNKKKDDLEMWNTLPARYFTSNLGFGKKEEFKIVPNLEEYGDMVEISADTFKLMTMPSNFKKHIERKRIIFEIDGINWAVDELEHPNMLIASCADTNRRADLPIQIRREVLLEITHMSNFERQALARF